VNYQFHRRNQDVTIIAIEEIFGNIGTSCAMRFSSRTAITLIVIIFAIFSIIGVLRSYSPIPEGDAWGGCLQFYADLLDGNYSAWLAQYEGTRPVLPRMLIWLDIRYFSGRFVFLIAANLIMLCGIIAILVAYLRRLTDEKSTQFIIGAVICVASVSWLQFANLNGGYSGANWFMAMLLPLAAFYWLARAQEQQRFFWLALLAGFASAWTLTNGILVLPLLATLALCIGFKPARIAMLAISGVATVALFFDFISTEQRSVLATYWSTLTGDPVGALQYVLGFLGNPFFYVVSYPLATLQYVFQGAAAGQAARPEFGGNLESDYPTAFATGLYTAQAAGMALIVAAMILAWRWLASGREAIRGALLTFLFFIIITAAASAAGRLTDYGVEYSFKPQYMTPVLLAWIALIVLGAASFNSYRAIGIFACVAILLFPSQGLPVFGLRRVEAKHERMLQAIQAILHGSDDPETLGFLVADPGVVRRLRGTKVSIFADGP
jgi:hypothetical protein